MSRQPESLLKIWTSYRFRGADWLNRLTVGGGLNGQTSAFRAGTACIEFGVRNPTTGNIPCTATADYNYTQAAYAVLSARADYKVNDMWSIALNGGGNILDKRYYQTMGASTGGNWYGEPRSLMLTVRGSF